MNSNPQVEKAKLNPLEKLSWYATLLISVGMVWLFAWLLNPNIDSGLVWILGYMLGTINANIYIVRLMLAR
jgi:predicted anti-sigma-YlaC factor YlaD